MSQFQNDKILIQQIADGDERAFEELFSIYFHYLHNVAYNRLQSKEVADDIVQEVFTDIWNNRNSLEIHTSFQAYLHQAVKNKVYKIIRHQTVRNKEMYIRRIYEEYYKKSSFPRVDASVRHEDLKSLVSRHLDELPEKSRTIFSMSRDDHYTHNEIAEQLNCSPKTVEYHIGKALKHLRVNLKDYVAALIPLALLLL
ncbi:MAG: RNA polymerase sigma-70 factor [Balneolaceae bacterium]|nr:RNA polymerase sigma-70 factor [Balneolaceae bacterium]